MPLRKLELRLHQVKCVEETNELFKDEISLGGTAVDESGDADKISSFRVKSFHTGGVQTYTPPRRLVWFNLTEGPVKFPKSYFVTLVLAEVDGGGFADFVDRLLDKVRDRILAIFEDVINAKLGTLGGPIGELISKVVAVRGHEDLRSPHGAVEGRHLQAVHSPDHHVVHNRPLARRALRQPGAHRHVTRTRRQVPTGLRLEDVQLMSTLLSGTSRVVLTPVHGVRLEPVELAIRAHVLAQMRPLGSRTAASPPPPGREAPAAAARREILAYQPVEFHAPCGFGKTTLLRYLASGAVWAPAVYVRVGSMPLDDVLQMASTGSLPPRNL